jgi:tetratricopeptide (TPR) repeat protein
MFWKQDIGKLQIKTADAEKLTDYKKRVEFFKSLSANAEKGKAQKLFDADTFFLSGKIYFLLGESYLGADFSDLFSEYTLFPINKKAGDSFTVALRDINKGIVLAGGSMPTEIKVLKAQIEYYLSYRDVSEIASSMKTVALANESLPSELVRFCALAVILGDDKQLGFKYLSEKGELGEDFKSNLYLAALEYYAKMYTSAIMRYKKILSETDNNNFKKTALLGLAQIYHTQSLDKECIEQIANAYEMFPDDLTVKMWVEKLRNITNDKPALKKIFNDLIGKNEIKENRENKENKENKIEEIVENEENNEKNIE